MTFGSPNFRYCTIGDESFAAITDLIERGYSTVILGPRGAGKRYLFALIQQRWLELNRRWHEITFDTNDTAIGEKKIVKRLCQLARLDPSTVTTFESYAEVLRSNSRPNLLLLVSNVDCLNRDLARRFLNILHDLVEEKILTAIISGESNLLDLVHGPNAEFSCTTQFVVHARDKAHFRSFMDQRLQLHRFKWPSEPSDAERLFGRAYELTGGDVVLLRAMLWCLSEDRAHHLKAAPKEPVILKAQDLPATLDGVHLIPTGGLLPFRYAINCIENDRESWVTLDRMLMGAPCFATDNAPTSLELSSLVQRHEAENNLLKWASAYAENFARTYFSAYRMGDLFASAGNWDIALGWYEQVPQDERFRPSNDEDNLALNRVLDSLTIKFNQLAPEKPGRQRIRELKVLLQRACSNIFGLPDVQFWKCTGDQWLPESTGATPGTARQLALVAQAGVGGSEGHFDHGACWAIFSRPAGNSFPQEAVIVNAEAGSMFPARRIALLRLMSAFRHAWEHASLLSAMNERLEHRRALLKITQECLHGLGNSDWSVRRVVRYAASQLVEANVGVTRVVILLRCRNEEKHQFQLAVDTASPSSESLPTPVVGDLLQNVFARESATEFPANPNPWNIIVTDREPLAGRTVAASLGMKSEHDTKQGVLIAEIGRGVDCSPALIEGLEIFCDRLGMSIELAKKFAFLQNSLDSLNNPTLVLDDRARARFLNAAAKSNFSLNTETKGWLPEAKELSALGMSAPVATCVTEMLTKQETVVRIDNLTTKMKGVWLAEVYPLKEWNNEPAGWFLHFRDRAFLFQAFDFMRAIARADTVQDALKILAQKMAAFQLGTSIQLRVYIIKRPDILHSFHSEGHDTELTALFAGEKIMLERDKHPQAWASINEIHAIVFRWQPDVPESKLFTNRGLKYRSVPTTHFAAELKKEPGAFWIDVPLFTRGEPFGKLTIAMSSADGEVLMPEISQLLQGLSWVIGDLIERLHRDIATRATLKANSETALAQAAHNLVNKFSGMNSLLGMYRVHQEECPPLVRINKEFEDYHAHAIKTLQRIKDRVGTIRLKPKYCDLAEIVERALRLALNGRNAKWSWVNGRPLLMGHWDPENAEHVFTELANDSYVFSHPDRPLNVTVSASIFAAGTANEAVRLQYCDNGRGVPAARKELIFEFGETFRAEVDVSGTGIGLDYVRRVVAARNGTVCECGVYGEGAKFDFFLPTRVPPNEKS